MSQAPSAERTQQHQRLRRQRLGLASLATAVAVALTFIIGGIMGGVGNYDLLKQARDEALSSSAAASSSQP